VGPVVLPRREAAILDVCARLNLRVADSDRRLYFPEIVVVPVLTNRTTIELMTFATDAIAELRLGTTTLYSSLMTCGRTAGMVDGLAERIIWPGQTLPRFAFLIPALTAGILSSSPHYPLKTCMP